MISIKVDGTVTCDCDKCYYILQVRDDNNHNIADALNKNFYFFKLPKKSYHKSLCKYHSIEREGDLVPFEIILNIIEKLKKVI